MEMAVRQAEAMDEELLGAIVSRLLAGEMRDVRGDGRMSRFEARQAAIVLLLGFAGLLRRGELAGIAVGWWRWLEGGALELVLSARGHRATKTDGERRGQKATADGWVLGFDLGRLFGEQAAQLEAWGLQKGAGFFRNAQQPAVKAWAADGEAVSKLVKRVVAETVAACGLVRAPAAAYSSHSLRRGGAQFLRDAGVSRDLVKLMGRWKSDAVDVYFSTACEKVVKRVAAVFRRVRGLMEAKPVEH